MSSSLPTVEERLANYYAAEARTLSALRTKRGDRERLNADLAEIQAGIRMLRAEMAAETSAANGRMGPAVMVAGFNPRFSGNEGGC